MISTNIFNTLIYIITYYIKIWLKCDDFLNIDMEQIDIAFIDIDLNVCNGINIAKYLRQLHPQLIIIFVSRREELVFQTFSTGVFQFIRKSKYIQDSKIVFEQLKKYLPDNFMDDITYTGNPEDNFAIGSIIHL